MMVERAVPLRLNKKGQEFSKFGKREWGWSNIDLGISHLIGIPSSLKIHRSELPSKEGKLCSPCRREDGLTGESLDSSHVVSWGIGRSDGSGGNGSVVADLFDPTVRWERLITVPEGPGTIPPEVRTERWESTRSSSRTSVDKHSPYDGYRRKGINLEIVPRLEKSIRPRYPRIGGRWKYTGSLAVREVAKRRITAGHLWTSWSTTSWWRVQSVPITIWGAWERPLWHWTSPWWIAVGEGHTLLWWCCRRTELPTGPPTGVLRPSGRTELLEALSGWWRESSDEETKGPRRGVRLWGLATHIRSVW